MSYTKLPTNLKGVSNALAALIPTGMTQDTFDALLASGVTVRLDEGSVVWAACVVQDNPDTPFVELLTVSMAGSNGTVSMRPNGEPVHRVFWHSMDPVLVAEQGLDNVRRDLLLQVLGEIPESAEDETEEYIKLRTDRIRERSIRMIISVANQVAKSPKDVL